MTQSTKKMLAGILIIAIIVSAIISILYLAFNRKAVPPTKYELSNNEIVFCHDVRVFKCGLYLTNCNNNKEYYCQTNITELK